MDQGLYGEGELAQVPEAARNLSRGCGNSTGFADLQPGETVVDFGCGRLRGVFCRSCISSGALEGKKTTRRAIKVKVLSCLEKAKC